MLRQYLRRSFHNISKPISAGAGGGGAPTFLIDEDFEETGTPTTGTWATSGAPDFDSTSHSVLTGQAADCVAGSFAVDYTATDVYIKFEYQAGGISSERYLFYLRQGPGLAGGLGLAIKQTAAEKLRIFINAGVGTASTTFTIQTATKYYIWADYKISGACYVGISTADVKPTSGTDTATAWADSGTDSVGATMGTINCVDSTGVSWFDNLQIAETEF
tara:strand:- start:1776 stop:2429 length:654 start_codon:yes stop_codon:yes gene_type:complete